jgi:hypothetical protein
MPPSALPSARFYHEAWKLARHTAPEVAQELIGLALHAEDEHVKIGPARWRFDRNNVE